MPDPKVLEHIVDTVLYFEGERNYSYRILRGVKNRFGSTNEIGVFEMTQEGLLEVENPSLMMLSGRPKNASDLCGLCHGRLSPHFGGGAGIGNGNRLRHAPAYEHRL